MEDKLNDEIEVGLFYAPAPMSEYYISVITDETKLKPIEKYRYKKVKEFQFVPMPEGDVIEIPIIAPCGDEITIKEQDGNRTYWHKGKMVWNPKEFHRVGLMTIMLQEDKLRYEEKYRAPIGDKND